MAPEQITAKSGPLTERTDVYALGGILYECLTGQPALLGASAEATMEKVLSDVPLRLRAVQSSIPWELEAICLKCLEKDPGERYASAAALAADLRRFLDEQPIDAVPLDLRARLVHWMRRHAISISGVALASTLPTLLLGAWLSWMMFGELSRQQDRRSVQLAVSNFMRDGAIDEAKVFEWIDSTDLFEPPPSTPGISTLLGLAEDRHEAWWRLLSLVGEDISQKGSALLGERLQARAAWHARDLLANADWMSEQSPAVANWSALERSWGSLESDPEQQVQAFKAPEDAVDGLVFAMVCNEELKGHAKCVEADRLMAESGRSRQQLWLELMVRYRQGLANGLRSPARRPKLSNSLAPEALVWIPFFWRLADMEPPFSPLADPADAASLHECRALDTAELSESEVSRCMELLERASQESNIPGDVLTSLQVMHALGRGRSDLQQRLAEWQVSAKQFGFIVKGCVPVADLEPLALEIVATPAAQLVPKVLARYPDCRF